MKNNSEANLTPFQIRNIRLLTHLYECNGVTDEIVELIRQSELDYFALIDKYKLLETKVNIDEKTNILKFKKDYLTTIIKTASRVYHGVEKTDYPISLVRFDIDDFSIFNNKYGHELGDIVLINVAKVLKDNSRPTDYIIRFGGEEFDVILPSTNISGSQTYVEKIFKKIQESKINYDGELLSITVSAGLSSYEYSFSGNLKIVDKEIEKQYKELQNNADDALYEAKYLGKNQFCVYSSEKKEKYVEMRKSYCNK